MAYSSEVFIHFFTLRRTEIGLAIPEMLCRKEVICKCSKQVINQNFDIKFERRKS